MILETQDKKVTFDPLRFLLKVRLEIIIFLAIIGAVLLLLPKAALVGLFSLLAAKILTLTIGVLLAHLLRIVAFNYLDLSEMIAKGRTAGVIFLAIWYAVIIYSIAVGG